MMDKHTAAAEVRARIEKNARELSQLYAGLSPQQIFAMVEEPAVEALTNQDGKLAAHGISLASHLVAVGAAVIPKDDHGHG